LRDCHCLLKLSFILKKDQGLLSQLLTQIASEHRMLPLYFGPNSPLVAETGEELVLPCSPQSSISAVDMTVKWIRPDRSDKLVHLYEGYEERNEKQIKSYRGRTSLFKEDLKNGNASLKLSALQPSDEGSYQCYIEYGQMYDDVTMYVEVKVKGKNQHDHHGKLIYFLGMSVKNCWTHPVCK
uniref:Ig-like domain-containing protein n=1 Tax=Astyanax mexicanus TaxID=7994 RepID=A0A8B9GRZ4_ASTMX